MVKTIPRFKLDVQGWCESMDRRGYGGDVYAVLPTDGAPEEICSGFVRLPKYEKSKLQNSCFLCEYWQGMSLEETVMGLSNGSITKQAIKDYNNSLTQKSELKVSKTPPKAFNRFAEIDIVD
jgi:hypothetical protein